MTLLCVIPAALGAPQLDLSFGTDSNDQPTNQFGFGSEPQDKPTNQFGFGTDAQDKPTTNQFGFGTDPQDKPTNQFGFGAEPKDKPTNQFGFGTDPQDKPTNQFSFNSGVQNQAFAPAPPKNDFSGFGSIVSVPDPASSTFGQPKSGNNFQQLDNSHDSQAERAKILEKFLDVTRQLLANLK